MSNDRDSQFLDYAVETTINTDFHGMNYLKGVTRGQQIMVDTMRRLIANKASLESMTATLNLIEKQLGGNDE